MVDLVVIYWDHRTKTRLGIRKFFLWWGKVGGRGEGREGGRGKRGGGKRREGWEKISKMHIALTTTQQQPLPKFHVPDF